MNTDKHEWNFENLVGAIRQAHEELAAQAGRAVNISLTLRNWLIGFYITVYEQNGADRAQYGAQLLENLSSRLAHGGMDGVASRSLRQYRQFYLVYPEIWQTPSAKTMERLIPTTIWQTLSAKSQPVPPIQKQPAIPAVELIQKLSFSHFAELIVISDETKRLFYEIECIRGNWSVRELKRQIGSLYYERSGLSKDKKELSKLAQKGAKAADPKLAIRDPYIFEFLGLKPREVMSESHLEDQLLNKLQDFLLELGHGFCFEARQKRILIGDTHNFVDLVFYHRILKCHVLVELKLEHFSHENIGQLNTYVSWYKKNMMTEGDNPPIGILLCTQRDQTLVEYALAGMDNGLFVSKYQLELPKKEEMQRFIEEQIRERDN
ncbi:MAG TPA: PDDEXK nuclease domain-containing protein [Smithellaceae bacterium]|jgi:predicted nuclease of restriction endonuclease-like (RecB) superfamily|nr:PDDEXK nuclease domain-containing protein [Smithellaceae bacterium]HQP25537.1 PDDEXK nuclease domain-containing protein [Smithellaceae bacterium]